MTRRTKKITRRANANPNKTELIPPESLVFVNFPRPDVRLVPSPEPKLLAKPSAGIPLTEDVTPETVFCIGFNKAFNSSFRAVAILLYSIFSSLRFFLRVCVLFVALGPFSGSKLIDL